MTWTRFVRTGVFGFLAGVTVWGCSNKPPADPLLTLASRDEVAHTRLEALKEVQAESATDPTVRSATQRVYRDIAWTAAEPAPVRLAVLNAMISDPDPAAAAQAKETCKLLLPRERSLAVVMYLSKIAADHGWTDCVPSLIRSYSRSASQVGWSGVEEESERPERGAIEALSGGKPVERVVFETFLNPPKLTETYGMDWAQRFRADAWDLLSRLDTDGSMRVKMISELPEQDADEAVRDVRECVKDLRAMPLTGEELKWLMALLDPKKKANGQWWTQASKAIEAVGADGRAGVLNLRHAEAIRWTSEHHPERLKASRGELLSELRSRLAERTIHERTAESGKYRVPERLEHWESRLKWGDLISILAIDEAIRDKSVVAALWTQAGLDRKDNTTEYGGVLMLRSALASTSGRLQQAEGEWIALLFPPRAGQRQGDERFVASEDMVATSDLALAHYHFHAQKTKNSEYAGPSPGDLVYAARSGRACVVVTTVGDGVMDADYYQPDGVVIDLGELGEK